MIKKLDDNYQYFVICENMIDLYGNTETFGHYFNSDELYPAINILYRKYSSNWVTYSRKVEELMHSIGVTDYKGTLKQLLENENYNK